MDDGSKYRPTIPREYAIQRTKHTNRLHLPSATARLMCAGLVMLAEIWGDALPLQSESNANK